MKINKPILYSPRSLLSKKQIYYNSNSKPLSPKFITGPYPLITRRLNKAYVNLQIKKNRKSTIPFLHKNSLWSPHNLSILSNYKVRSINTLNFQHWKPFLHESSLKIMSSTRENIKYPSYFSSLYSSNLRSWEVNSLKKLYKILKSYSLRLGTFTDTKLHNWLKNTLELKLPRISMNQPLNYPKGSEVRPVEETPLLTTFMHANNNLTPVEMTHSMHVKEWGQCTNDFTSSLFSELLTGLNKHSNLDIILSSLKKNSTPNLSNYQKARERWGAQNEVKISDELKQSFTCSLSLLKGFNLFSDELANPKVTSQFKDLDSSLRVISKKFLITSPRLKFFNTQSLSTFKRSRKLNLPTYPKRYRLSKVKGSFRNFCKKYPFSIKPFKLQNYKSSRQLINKKKPLFNRYLNFFSSNFYVPKNLSSLRSNRFKLPLTTNRRFGSSYTKLPILKTLNKSNYPKLKLFSSYNEETLLVSPQSFNLQLSANTLTAYKHNWSIYYKEKNRLNVLPHLVITPVASLCFVRSFAFFTIGLHATKASNWDSLLTSTFNSDFDHFLIFPDPNQVKANFFRKLNKQKLFAQARISRFLTLTERLHTNSEFRYSNKELTRVQTPTALSTLTSFSHWPFFRNNWTLFTLKRLSSFSVTYTSQDSFRIRRIRFKPGYGRIWREARSSVKEFFKLSTRYQYRLTPKLQKIYFQIRRKERFKLSYTLEISLLASQLAADHWSVAELFKNSNVYLNGNLALNPQTNLFSGDFVQLIVNLRFYLATRWSKALTGSRRGRVSHIFARKFRPSGTNRNIRIMRTLPDWFYDLQYTYADIPKFYEVDFFTLSIFVLHDYVGFERSSPANIKWTMPPIVNMYNWKYIT